MTIIALEPDRSEEIFNELRGSRFIAMTFHRESGTYKFYDNNLSSPEIVYCCSHMINRELEFTHEKEK